MSQNHCQNKLAIFCWVSIRSLKELLKMCIFGAYLTTWSAWLSLSVWHGSQSNMELRNLIKEQFSQWQDYMMIFKIMLKSILKKTLKMIIFDLKKTGISFTLPCGNHAMVGAIEFALWRVEKLYSVVWISIDLHSAITSDSAENFLDA